MIIKLCALSDIAAPALGFLRTRIGATAGTALHQLPSKPGLLMNITTKLTGYKPRTLLHAGATAIDAGITKIPQPIKTWGSRVAKTGLDLADVLT